MDRPYAYQASVYKIALQPTQAPDATDALENQFGGGRMKWLNKRRMCGAHTKEIEKPRQRRWRRQNKEKN